MLLLEALRCFRSERRAILLLVAVSLVAAVFEAGAVVLLVPLATTIAAGDDAVRRSLAGVELDLSVGQMIGLSVAATVTFVLLQVGIAKIKAIVAARYQRRLRLRVHAAYFESDWETQAAADAGELLELSGSMAHSAGTALRSLVSALTALASLITFVLTAFFIDPVAAAVVAACAALLGVGLRPMTIRVKRLSQAVVPRNLARAALLSEQVRFAREIRLFRSLDEATRRMDESVTEVSRMREQAAFYASAVIPLYRGAGVLLALATLGVATTLTEDRLVALGAVALLLLRSLAYGQQLQTAVQQLNQLLPSVSGVEDAVAGFDARVDPDGTEVLGKVEHLEVRHVGYRYATGTEALHDVSFSVSAGETIGVVGSSGSGKSTLAQVVLRLRRPTSGTVLVNGRDIAGFTSDSWYRQVAIVPQQTELLNATVAENIAFFRSELDRADVERAARAAHLHDVIAGLQDGYDTVIGPATRDLSGGQVQRIGIARALAGTPSILVLDEPTSALDSYSESVIQQTVAGLGPSVLRIVIAHRLSTLEQCDRLLVLAGGRLVEEGPAAELLRRSDLFTDPSRRAALDLA